jgi:hypothetical protein
MEAKPKRQFALDTNFLLNMAAGADFALEFKEVFQGKGYALRLPPTAMVEVYAIHVQADAPHKRELAGKALFKLREWRVVPYVLPPVQRAIAKCFASSLMLRRLIPEAEFNDGLILAETALEGIPLLVSSDKHLLDIDESDLALAFDEADLPLVMPVHPKRLLRAVR